MKVKELIELLQQTDPERRVVIEGYETGFDDPEVKPNARIWDHGEGEDRAFCGRYDTDPPYDVDPDDDRRKPIIAFALYYSGINWEPSLDAGAFPEGNVL